MIYLSITVLTLILSFASYLAIWSRRPTNARFYSLILLPVLLAVSSVSVLSVLGNPTHCIVGTTIPKGKLNVLGFKIIKDDRIYLLLDTPSKPTYCSIPFNAATASSLQEGQRSGEGSETDGEGNGLMGQLGFGPEDAPKPLTIHPRPVEPSPPKPEEETQTFGE